ncbi:MAG: helix-turn-helix transcriptional regulator [Kiritimatiellae bacterium]|nr:helix-turn-helix transcriptional regulator [Kiritimatiellia bacterium]
MLYDSRQHALSAETSPLPGVRMSFKPELLPWEAGAEMKFSPEGKHEPEFPEEFPFLLASYSFPRDMPLTPNYHDYLEITYVHRGRGVFHVENKDYPIERGDVYIINNTEFHVVESKDPRQLKTVSLFFMPELIHSPGGPPLDFEFLRPFYDKRIEFSHRIPAKDIQNEVMTDLIGKIFVETEQRQDGYPLAIKTYLCEILLLLLRYYQKRRPGVRNYTEKRHDFQRLRKVIVHLHKNFQEKITLNDMAKLAAMSPHYFCKFFKRNTGQTLTEFILRMRVDRAKELLIQSRTTVTEIAFALGFDNHSYFDRVFKRLVGVTPVEYRRQSADGAVE